MLSGECPSHSSGAIGVQDERRGASALRDTRDEAHVNTRQGGSRTRKRSVGRGLAKSASTSRRKALPMTDREPKLARVLQGVIDAYDFCAADPADRGWSVLDAVISEARDILARERAIIRAEYERVDVGTLCRAFGLSVAEAKQGLERTGFLYRRLASPPQDFHDAEGSK